MTRPSTSYVILSWCRRGGGSAGACPGGPLGPVPRSSIAVPPSQYGLKILRGVDTTHEGSVWLSEHVLDELLHGGEAVRAPGKLGVAGQHAAPAIRVKAVELAAPERQHLFVGRELGPRDLQRVQVQRAVVEHPLHGQLDEPR